MPTRSSRAAVLFGAFTAITAWFALILQLYLMIDNTPDNGMTPIQAVARFFIFFTILCNLLVATSLTAILINPASAAGRFFAKPSSLAAVALNIFIVGVVYNIILRGLMELQGWQRFVDEVLHVVVPVLYVLYWLIFAPKQSLKWSDPVKWLSFPALYLVYALIRGGLEGFYPYPFIDVNKLGYSRVALNSAGLMVAFVITGLLFVYIGKTMSREKQIR